MDSQLTLTLQPPEQNGFAVRETFKVDFTPDGITFDRTSPGFEYHDNDHLIARHLYEAIGLKKIRLTSPVDEVLVNGMEHFNNPEVFKNYSYKEIQGGLLSFISSLFQKEEDIAKALKLYKLVKILNNKLRKYQFPVVVKNDSEKTPITNSQDFIINWTREKTIGKFNESGIKIETDENRLIAKAEFLTREIPEEIKNLVILINEVIDQMDASLK